MEHPRLRPVEALPAQEGLICLRDPEGFSDRLVLVPPNLLYLVSLFDGQRSILDIQAEYTRRFGELIFGEKVREIIGQLDRCLLLDSPRFRKARERAVAEFRAAPLRSAAHAGAAYEAEAGDLRRRLDRLFASGTPPPERRADPAGRMQGLIAPHIDPSRGGQVFAAAYAELARECSARTFVILGIAHQPTRHRFVLTAKDFDTPLGTVPADRDFIERLAGRCGADFFADEFAHRGEHSVEFQAVFLRYLFPAPRPLRIVPVLCASLHHLLPQDGSPEADPEVREFLHALGETLKESKEEVALIAGVDFSHVGRRFGQDVELTEPYLADLAAADRALLRRVEDHDAEGFFGAIRRTGDASNVCGTPAVYTLLKLLAPGSARLLDYDQAVDREGGSAVSFAAAAFYGS